MELFEQQIKAALIQNLGAERPAALMLEYLTGSQIILETSSIKVFFAKRLIKMPLNILMSKTFAYLISLQT